YGRAFKHGKRRETFGALISDRWQSKGPEISCLLLSQPGAVPENHEIDDGRGSLGQHRRIGSNSSSKPSKPLAKSLPVNRRARSFPRRIKFSRFALSWKSDLSASAISNSLAGFTRQAASPNCSFAPGTSA